MASQFSWPPFLSAPVHCSALFERATHLQLPPKKMKFLFKRYLDYEKKHGDAARCARALLMAGAMLTRCCINAAPSSPAGALLCWFTPQSWRSFNLLPPLMPPPRPAAWSTSSGGQWSMLKRRQRHDRTQDV